MGVADVMGAQDDRDLDDLRALHDDGRDVAPDDGPGPAAAPVSPQDALGEHAALPAAGADSGPPVASGGEPPAPFDAERDALVLRDGRNGERRVTQRGLELIEDLAGNKALTDASIAAALRMDRSTFREVRRRQPEVDEALLRGRSHLEDVLVHSLLRRALNPKDPGGMVSAMFLLKARCGYREGSVAESASLSIAGENVQVVLAPQLSREAFQELLARAEDRGDERGQGGVER